ncbi:MAG TPA: hypothetical protein VG826_25795 [Pirellulales bacterium]|nr:hypothetical protein [Pirellulales bacterium]
MSRPQFTIRTLLILMFGAACFFGGISFERERSRREDEAMFNAYKTAPVQVPASSYVVRPGDDEGSLPTITVISEEDIPAPEAPQAESK